MVGNILWAGSMIGCALCVLTEFVLAVIKHKPW